jgi:hypothetical protein
MRANCAVRVGCGGHSIEGQTRARPAGKSTNLVYRDGCDPGFEFRIRPQLIAMSERVHQGLLDYIIRVV